jgi:hypothetical protein
MPIRIFLSHSSKDKLLAASIQQELLQYGLEVFVAHSDIHPSEEWQQTILKELKRCHIFMPLLTNSFRTSDWTDQETGIATTQAREIMPLAVSVMPYGFIWKHQAFKFKRTKVKESCAEIARAIDAKPRLRRTFRQWLINSLKHSWSSDMSVAITKLVEYMGRLSAKSVQDILRFGLHNVQAFQDNFALISLRTFFKRNRHVLSKSAQKRFQAALYRTHKSHAD